MKPDSRILKHVTAWNRRPSRATAKSLYQLVQKKGGLSAPGRGAGLIPLGEAAEMDWDFNLAQSHYLSVVATANPLRDERLYARAAARCLLNTPRLRQVDLLHGVARLVQKLKPGQRTPRLAWLGAVAHGLLAVDGRQWDRARKSFEEAMGAAWESNDAEAEALAHHLLGQTWLRLEKLARARQHITAAREAGRRSGLWLVEKRLDLEALLFELSMRIDAGVLMDLRGLISEIRKTGFPRFEFLAWFRLGQCLAGRPEARIFHERARKLVRQAPPVTPAARPAAPVAGGNGPVQKELRSLVRMARE